MSTDASTLPLGVLRISGPEAVDFLQALVSSDLRALDVGAWHWSALLSPQGRVQATGVLCRPEPERLLWLLPVERIEPIQGHLRRYLLRRKAVVEVEAAAVADGGGDFDTPVLAAAAGSLADDAQGLQVLGLDASGRALQLLPPLDPGAGGSFRSADIAAGLPWVQGAAADAFTAHMIALPRLGAASLSKGCYPGQEIVSRTHYLGRGKRALFRVRGFGPAPEAGATLASSSGRLLLAVNKRGGWQGLAVLPEETPTSGEAAAELAVLSRV